jgi:hypothetical protein
MKRIAIILGLTAAAVAQRPNNDWREKLSNREATLADVRQILLNKKVVILGAIAGNTMLEWTFQNQTDNQAAYYGRHANIPASYKGKVAEVVSVELAERERDRPSSTNALGEPVSDGSVVNPYFQVVVRFDNGILAATAAFPNTISGNLDLASGASTLADQINAKLPRLIGKTVYVVEWSTLWQPNTSLEEMTEVGSYRSKFRLDEIPRLQPLRIIAGKYIESVGVVYKLKLPNGKEALSFESQEMIANNVDPDQPFESRLLGSLLTSIPKFPPQVMEVVKQGWLIRGMSKFAMECSIGFSDKENDWGRGGKQIIYHGGSLIVYLDKNENVVDWQTFGR